MCVDCVLASPRIAQVDPSDGPLPEVVLLQLLTTSPVLTQPDIAKHYDVYCDASRKGLGGVLMQEG
jgi:hypothetical protein